MIYENKNFLIVGVSASGFYSAKLLKSLGANVFLYDDKPNKNIEDLKKEGCCDLSDKSMDEVLSNIYCIVKSPGVPCENKLTEAAFTKRIPIISEIELGFYNYKGVCVAVTGTNGKSTVTTLIDYIINNSNKKSYLCGNIGIPFTKFCKKSYDTFCCIEVSSFQLENCYEFKPHIAVMLNITEDHVDRHHTMQNYIKAKKRIFQNQKFTEYAVLNFDCDVTRQLFESINSDVYWFSVKQKVKGAYLENNALKFCGEEIININDIKIKGQHNILNCLAAICAAKILGIQNEVIARSLTTFEGIPHRLQFAGTADGITFYNDSKATNTNSAITAAKAMQSGTVMLLGGYDKGADFKPFFKELCHLPQISSCVLYGDVKEKLINDAKSVGYSNYTVCNKLEDSVKAAYSLCKRGGTVLLSPACASFDQFNNYEERGNAFLAMVKDIINA